MKKSILISFIVMLSGNAFAQRFFQGYEILPYFYKDDVHYSGRDWKQVFDPPGTPRSPNVDSLRSTARHPDRPANYGVQFRLYRVLYEFKTELHTWNLEWHAGPGYRGFKTSPSSYSTDGISTDTSQIALYETERFELKYHYLDLYSSITIRNADGPLHVFIGFGLQASMPLGQAMVEEEYHTRTYKWNTVMQRWEQLGNVSRHYTSNAVRTYVFSFSVPLGLSFDLGNNSELKFNGEYFNARRSPRVGDKNSEGILLQFGFRYAFP